MASDPNKSMEELLKACAQQRGRDAPPFELPPATRRTLLAEAARRYGPGATGRAFAWDWVRGFRLRLAYAIAAVAVLAALVWSFVPKGSQPAQLAQRTPEIREELKEKGLNPPAYPVELAKAKPQPAAPAVAQPALDRDPLRVAEAADKTPAPLASAKPEAWLAVRANAEKPQELARESNRNAPAPMNQPATPPAQPVIPPATPASALALKPEAARAEPVTAPPNLASVMAGVTQQAQNLAALRQRFEQALPTASFEAVGRPADAAPVLRSFELERTGNHLRLIDADGSVYEGDLVTSLEALRSRPDQLTAPDPQQTRRLSGPLLKQQPILEKARRGLAPPEGQEYAVFRASGTNRTLKLPVVIEAGFVPAPQSQAAPAPGAGPALSLAPAPANQPRLKPSAPAQPPANLAPQLNIQGLVRIGATNQLPLDARPVSNEK